jgi:hypothetical protein
MYVRKKGEKILPHYEDHYKKLTFSRENIPFLKITLFKEFYVSDCYM